MARSRPPKVLKIDPDLIRVRTTWGPVKPVTRLHGDRRKELNRRACRGKSRDLSRGEVFVGAAAGC
jgi:hypothetical protein